MPFETGSATDYLDLLAKLEAFVTGVALGAQAWTALRSESDELILQGPGLAGLDEIIVGIKTYESVGNDYYNWRLMGATGFSDGMAFDEQPGILNLTQPRVHLWNQTIPYWFVANGRRIIMVAKVSTVYEAMYLGFIRQYATPGQYPYPLVVGGSSTAYSGERWSTVSGDHSHFANPGGYALSRASMAIRAPSGGWKGVRNRDLADSYYIYPETSVYPFMGVDGGGDNAAQRMKFVREGLDGTYPMIPLVIHSDTPDLEIYGELEGCFWATGYENAVENTIQDGGPVDHLVVQNVYRASISGYWALRLE